VGVYCDDGKRPDGMSLIPWRQGLLLLWDFTCFNTFTPSNVSTSSKSASRLANSVESTTTFHFSLLCVETFVLGDPVHVHCCSEEAPYSHGAGGLGRVCFSAHGMMIDVDFASDDLNALLTVWL